MLRILGLLARAVVRLLVCSVLPSIVRSTVRSTVRSMVCSIVHSVRHSIPHFRLPRRNDRSIRSRLALRLPECRNGERKPRTT